MTSDPQPSIHDIAYADMLRHILENGDGHADRTGTGTTSVFGYQNRYPLQAGFPLLHRSGSDGAGVAEVLPHGPPGRGRVRRTARRDVRRAPGG